MLHKYTEFINENFYDDFKSKYSKLFNDADSDISTQIQTLFKKIDDETDQLKIVNIYDDFLTVNQRTLNDKIKKSEGKESIDKLLSDNLMAIYFTLKSMKIKLDDVDFTNTFEKSRDKNLQSLMSMKQDKFSDAYQTYVKDYMIPQIEEMSGVEKVQEANEQGVQVQTAQPVQPEQSTQEESTNDNNQQLETYKTKSEEWFNTIYGLIWDKLKTVKNKLSTNQPILNSVDQVANLMKSSTNNEAKIQLLNKIVSLSKDELNKLAGILNLNIEELGDF